MKIHLKYIFLLCFPVVVLAGLPDGITRENSREDQLVFHLRFSNPHEDTLWIEGQERARITFAESNATRDDSVCLTRVLRLPLALTGMDIPDVRFQVLESVPFRTNRLHADGEFVRFSPVRIFRTVPLADLIVDPFAISGKFITEARLILEMKPSPDLKHTRSPGSEEEAFFRHGVINPENVRITLPQINRQLQKAFSRAETGTWYRLGIRGTGMYEISGQYLEDNGLVLSELDKNRIHLYVSATRGRPYSTALPESPYIREIPVLITGNTEDPLRRQDKILFFGESVSGWYSRSEDGPQYAAFETNPYETVNHYWLFIADTPDTDPLRMSPIQDDTGADAVNLPYAWGRMHYEKDEANLIQGGTDWYGESFSGPGALRTIQIFLNNPAPEYHENAYIRFGVAGASKTGLSTHRHDFEFTLNNEVIWGVITAYDYNDASKVFQIHTDILQENNTLLIEYTGNGDNTKAFLDFVDIIYPMGLEAADDFLRIWHPVSDMPLAFPVSGFTGNLVYIFDVSDPLNPRYQIQNQSSFSIIHSRTGLEADYLVLSESRFQEPLFMELSDKSPQLPESFEQTDMVIVTYKDFLPAAERLKEYRESHPSHPLSVGIYTMEDIYAWYSGGNQDPHAIRNLLYDMTQRAPQPSPFYLVLLGDGDYDYRNISGKSKIFVPQYEISAGSIIHTRNTDDPFVYLSSVSDESPDMAVGRIPVNSLEEAQNYIQKLIDYETRETPGEWQMRATLIADDPTNPWPNEPEFIKDTEYKIQPVLPKAMKFHKIYLTEFPELYDPTIGSMGRVGAREAILEAFQQGTLLMNYIGHGSPFVWAQEYVFTKDRDLNQVQTNGMYPFIVAATCDWGRSDYIGIQSMAEEMVNLTDNGAIGVVASTRGVINLDNVDFTRKMYNTLFPESQSSTRCVTVGNAYLQGKIQAWSNLNVSKFQYFGDPALMLAIPRMGGEIHVENQDTLKALSLVSVKGTVFDQEQNKINQEGLTGWIELVDSDKQIARDYRYLSGGTYRTGTLYYTLPGSRLFTGAISIENGEFNTRFMIPKDIRYEGNNGKIRLRYASPDYRLEGAAFVDSLILAGSSDTVSADFTGPEIVLQTHGESFASSSILVSDTADLIIRIKDPSGINITGATGHAIIMRRDGLETNLTSQFIYDKDSWKEGSITLPVKQWFGEGEQTLEISAFDNFNNFSSETFYLQVISSGESILTDVMNFPNPFRESTQFTFHNMQAGEVDIKIFTLSGALIQSLDGGFIDKGFNRIPWDGRDRFGEWPAAGIYMYTLSLKHDTGESSARGKLVILP
ncbi:MAG: type IX secretion system sortase PorU [Fidelibacterota bacterium]